MNFLSRFILLVCFITSILHASDDGLLVSVRIIAMPKVGADQFLGTLNSATISKESMAELMQKVKIKQAECEWFSAVRMKSGVRATNQSGLRAIVEMDASVNNGFVRMNICPEIGSAKEKLYSKVRTQVAVKIGTTQLLGTADDPGDGPTRLFFVTAQ